MAVTIISNQTDETITENAEEEIINSGAEANADALSQIVLIDQTQYNALSDDEKKLYVKYNPSLTSQAYVQYITLQNKLVEQFNQLAVLLGLSPGIDNLSEINSFLSPVKSIADTCQTIIDTISSITSALSEVGLGALENILTGILRLLGAIAAILYLMMRNPYLMMKQYTEAFDSIDFASLKEYFEGDTTPNLEQQQIKVSQMIIPDEEIRTYVDENVTNLNEKVEKMRTCYTTVETLQETKEMAETIQDTMDACTIAMCVPSAGLAEMAKQMVVDQFNEVFDNYKDTFITDSKDISSSVNNFIHDLPQKYIKIEDLETLKRIEAETNG